MRTLDDRGRSKGHRYRPACDALQTVAGDVEGGRRPKSDGDGARRGGAANGRRGGGGGGKGRRRRTAGEGKHRRRSAEKRRARVGPPADATTFSAQIQNASHTHSRSRASYKSTVHHRWGGKRGEGWGVAKDRGERVWERVSRGPLSADTCGRDGSASPAKGVAPCIFLRLVTISAARS